MKKSKQMQKSLALTNDAIKQLTKPEEIKAGLYKYVCTYCPVQNKVICKFVKY